MNNTIEIKRGQVYHINPGYNAIESESSRRFAVIVSADSLNRTQDYYQIAYLTTSPISDMPTHVTTRATGVVSVVLCEKIFTIRPDRIEEYIGELNDTEMVMLDSCLALSLGLKSDFKYQNEPDPAEEPEEPESEPDFILDTDMETELEKLDKELAEYKIQLAQAETKAEVYEKLYHDLLERMLKE